MMKPKDLWNNRDGKKSNLNTDDQRNYGKRRSKLRWQTPNNCGNSKYVNKETIKKEEAN